MRMMKADVISTWSWPAHHRIRQLVWGPLRIWWVVSFVFIRRSWRHPWIPHCSWCFGGSCSQSWCSELDHLVFVVFSLKLSWCSPLRLLWFQAYLWCTASQMIIESEIWQAWKKRLNYKCYSIIYIMHQTTPLMMRLSPLTLFDWKQVGLILIDKNQFFINFFSFISTKLSSLNLRFNYSVYNWS